MPDYIFSAEDQLPRTATEQWEANMAAIRVVKDIEAEGRSATPEEQAILARYSGFGNSAFGQAFANRPTNQAWAKRGRELRSLITPEEYESIRGSRLNAFYTTSDVINSMWGSLMDMGAGQVESPVVLEPSAGAGRFLGLQPPEMAKKSRRIAVELDSLTGTIAKHAYPDTQVHVAGYEDVHIPDDYVDIAISNVPFGNYPVYDDEYADKDHMTRSIHNYFFGKTVDKLKPGGVAAFITTHHTLDSPQARQFREDLAQEADFLGAVRLPNDAFPDTQVVTDIIYLRKRDPGDNSPIDRSWVDTTTVALPTDYEMPYGRYGQPIGVKPQEYSVNQYFRDNPDRILGIQDGTGTMRGPNQYNVRSRRGDEPLAERVEEVTKAVAEKAPKFRIREVSAAPDTQVKLKRERDAEAAARPSEGQFRLSAGRVERVVGGTWQPAELARGAENRVKGMLGVRNEVRSLMEMEMSGDVEEETLNRQREVARKAYEDFVGQHGDLNDRQNVRVMSGDPDAHFLKGLEVFKDDEWKPADIFQRRAFSPAAEYSASSPQEALDVSLNVKGRVDVDYMAEMLGQPKNVVVQQLAQEGMVFLNPETRQFEPRSQYLSGTVAEKLALAREASEQNPAYRANIEALEQVQPEKVPIGDIYMSMSSSWMPEDVMNEGLAHVLSGGNRYHREVYRRDGQPARMVAFSPETGMWGATAGMVGRRSGLNSQWGTGEVPAHRIIEHAVSNRPIKVFVKDDEGNRVFSETESRAAQNKIDELRTEFKQWALEDPERAALLEDRYNSLQNISIPREYSHGHMTFPGMAAKWQRQLYPHQREAAARIVQDGNVMLAHEVGFGKTQSMVTGAMERKRLGLTQKPMFVLPKATAAQFAGDFRALYPNAKILFQEKIGPEDRKVFLDRVRNNDWDAVLVTYNQFEAIPVTTGTLDQYQGLMMGQLDAAEAAAKEVGAEYQEKQIQALKKKADTAFKKRRSKLNDMFDKGAVPFEHLGVDQLFVDEADNFKNLGFFTSLEDIKGLNPTTQSMRGWDMFMKTQLLQGRSGQIRNNKGEVLRGGVVFATGSSISNSLAEMWTMMRYLQLEELEKRGLDAFDAWAANYGQMENTIEVRASGQYKPTTRFSKFANQPELSALWQNVADIRVQSELPEMLERQPKMVDREGNPKRIDVQSPMTADTRSYMQHIAQRATELDADTQRDNMLKLSGDARKASLDVRFAPHFNQSAVPWPPGPGYQVEANPEGKLPLMVENVAEVYHRESPDKGTQLIFLDMGTPKPSSDRDTERTSKETDEEDELELSQEDQAQLTETYNMIRRGLEAKGIPASEIAFIHDYQRDEQKKKLFQKVNDGKVRVLLGSTNKLGVGVNVQERLAAVHHVDVPWRPRDVEQREGRIIRAGNQVYGPKFDEDTGEMIDKGRGVQIFKYIQQGSFDEFMWQAVEKKAAGIKAITKRHVTARETEDIDDFVLSAAEARALASGNPKAVELVTLETKLAGMKLDRAAYESQRSNAQAQIGTLTQRIDFMQGQLPAYQRDAATAAQVLESDTFAASDPEGRPFEKRADAEKAFKERLAKTPFGGETELGTYKGFKVYGANKDVGYQVVVQSVGTGQKYFPTPFDDPAAVNILTRVDNQITKMVAVAEDRAEQLADAQQSLKSFQTQMEKPYDQLPEMLSLERKVRDLRREVQGVEDTSAEGQAAEFSMEQLVQEDIEQASDEDMIAAEERLLAKIMERRREDRSYQTPTGKDFDSQLSDALQEILEERRQQEEAGIDPHVDEDLLDEVPDFIPEKQKEAVADAIDEAFDIDPQDVTAAVEETEPQDLTPTEKSDVVERVAERIHEESEEDGAKGRVTVVSLDDVDALLMEEMKDEGVEEGVIPQHADTDYNEDAYIDVDGTMVQEGPAEEEPEPAPMTPLVKVGSSRQGITDRLAELVAETAAVRNAHANTSGQNLDVEINQQIQKVATDSLSRYRNDQDFVDFYNALGSDRELLAEINSRVHSRLDATEAEPEMAAPVEAEPDTGAEDETLSDRIRDFGDTGFVDPDDYESMMDAGFDGDIAEVDSLEDLEAHVQREPHTIDPPPAEFMEQAAELVNASHARQLQSGRGAVLPTQADKAFEVRELAELMHRASGDGTPLTAEEQKHLDWYGPSREMPEEVKEELADYESQPSPAQGESQPMTQEDIDRLQQYESNVDISINKAKNAFLQVKGKRIRNAATSEQMESIRDMLGQLGREDAYSEISHLRLPRDAAASLVSELQTALAEQREAEPVAAAEATDPWAYQYEGLEWYDKPEYGDVDTDYVTPHGTASELRYRERRDRLKESTQASIDQMMKALEEGNTLYIQYPGRGKVPKFTPSVLNQDNPPFRVGSDGQMEILEGYTRGKPRYVTVLSPQVVVEGPAAEEPATVPTGTDTEPAPAEEMHEAAGFLKRLKSVASEVPTKGKGSRTKQTNQRHLRRTLEDAMDDTAATDEKLGFAVGTFREAFAGDEDAISLANDIDAYLAKKAEPAQDYDPQDRAEVLAEEAARAEQDAVPVGTDAEPALAEKLHEAADFDGKHSEKVQAMLDVANRTTPKISKTRSVRVLEKNQNERQAAVDALTADELDQAISLHESQKATGGDFGLWQDTDFFLKRERKLREETKELEKTEDMPLPEPAPDDEEPYWFRETDLETGETVTHIEDATPAEAAEILEDIGPSPEDDRPATVSMDTDPETGEVDVTITEAPAEPAQVAEVREADAETSGELADICREYGDKTTEELERDIESLNSRLDTLERKTGLDLDRLPANAVKLELNDDGSVSVQTAPDVVKSEEPTTTKAPPAPRPETESREPAQPRQQQPSQEWEGDVPATDESPAADWDSLTMAQKRRAVKEINAVLEKLAVARALRAQVQQGASLSEAVNRYCALLTLPLAAASLRLSSLMRGRPGPAAMPESPNILGGRRAALHGRRTPKRKDRDWAAEMAGKGSAVPAPVVYVK